MRRLGLGVLGLLVVIQFIRPEKNDSNSNRFSIEKEYQLPGEIKQILDAACMDCHSNFTRARWYFNIQPIGWWIAHHVDEGKEELNFSEFIKKPIAVQNHKLEEIVESQQDKWMPIKSYTMLGLHSEANLTDEERTKIINWAKELMNEIEQKYSPDSLVLKRTKKE